MTAHSYTRWDRWELIAGVPTGPMMTQCGIEVWDMTTADFITQDTKRVDCPGCLAPTPIEQETALREYLESVSERGTYESNAGWALRLLKERTGERLRLTALEGAIAALLPTLRRHSTDHDFHGEIQEVLALLRRGIRGET